MFLWIKIRQTFLGRYIISLFDYNRPTWIQALFVEQVFFKKNLNFNMQGDTSMFTLPHKTSSWHFCQSATLPGNVNKKVCPNIWNRNIFELVACVHWECIGSFKDKSCLIGYVRQLNWNLRAQNRASYFNGFELYVKLELFRSSYFGSKCWFC